MIRQDGSVKEQKGHDCPGREMQSHPGTESGAGGGVHSDVTRLTECAFDAGHGKGPRSPANGGAERFSGEASRRRVHRGERATWSSKEIALGSNQSVRSHADMSGIETWHWSCEIAGSQQEERE